MVHRLVNGERAKMSRAPLSYDHHLAFIARGHSRDMAKHGYCGHINHKGENATARAQRKGYKFDGFYVGLGENCRQDWLYGINEKGWKYRRDLALLAEEAVGGWMKSAGHRKNILRPEFTVIGIGFAESKDHKEIRR